MKAKQYRIGNLIKYDNRVFEIDVIANEFPTLNTPEFGIGVVDWNNIEPILLTEEWHNKFGVKKDGFGAFEYKIPRKNNSNIKVIFSRDYVMLRQGKGRIDDDLIAIWNKDIKKRDMFVHEWQNLYFSLCGEELMIKE
jgi:hypothetical protein